MASFFDACSTFAILFFFLIVIALVSGYARPGISLVLDVSEMLSLDASN